MATPLYYGGSTLMVDKSKNKYRSGFTIVELIVVIVVIAVLAAIVLISYGAWRSSIATSSVTSDLTHAASTMESSRGFNNGYPVTIPATFTASANNTIVLTVADTKSYCIDGTTSVSASIQYYIDNLTQNNGPSKGTCATRTNLPVPGQVTNVAFTTGSSDVDVSWVNTSPNYAQKYTVQCAQDPAFITGLISQNVDGTDNTSAGVAGASATTTYYCRVRGENNNGQGPWSNVSSGDTQAQGCADSDQYGTYPDCYDFDSLPPATSIAGYWTAPPPGYLLEDGSAISRTDYADLFYYIGTTYGAGDGATTFNLPDTRGRATVAYDQLGSGTEFNTIGKKYGEKAHTITLNETPAHVHAQYVTANSGGAGVRNDWTSDGASTAYAQGVNTNSTGSGAAANIMQPSIVLQYAIKYRKGTGGGSSLAPGTTIQGYWYAIGNYYREDGTALSRSAYPDLFNAIGTTYGAGDGSTTFNVPNSVGRVGVERNPSDMQFATLGQTYGEKTHLLTIAEMATHSHTELVTANATGSAVRDDYASDATGKPYAQGVNTGSAGGGQAFNVIQPSIVKSSEIKTAPAGNKQDAGMITGTSIEGWWASAPAGYLLEDGSAVSRDTYADLFNLIGTAFGSGDGSTTFNLPDARGRVAVNVNPADPQLSTIGATLGEKTHIMTISELVSHSHAQYVTKAATGGSGVRADYSKDAAGAIYTQGVSTGTAGLSTPYNIIQPSIAKNFAIKY